MKRGGEHGAGGVIRMSSCYGVTLNGETLERFRTMDFVAASDCNRCAIVVIRVDRVYREVGVSKETRMHYKYA